MERLHWHGPTAQEDAGMVSSNPASSTDAGHEGAARRARGESGGDRLTQDATPAQNEALIRAYIAEVFNGHHLDGLAHYWAEAMTSHWMGQETLHGLSAWREGMVGFFAAFPDAAYTLDDLFCVADHGIWRGSWQATQRGEWEGIAPSGNTVRWSVIIIGRFSEGKLVEDWVEYDRIGLYRQLGAIPLQG
jgi:predicted ester cyclase